MITVLNKDVVSVRTDDPEAITAVIERSKHVAENEVWVKFGLGEMHILNNMGFKNVPSPISTQYQWTGMYKPFDHQRVTAEFLTLNKKCFCLSEMGCVDSETEYLSPTGWRNIAEYVSGKVAQYLPNTGEVKFVTPEAYIKKPCERMYHFKTKYGVNQMLSPEHRMIVGCNKGSGKQVVMSAEDMFQLHELRGTSHTKCAKDKMSFSSAATPATYIHRWGGAGLPISLSELRVQAAVIADGHFPSSTNLCTIRLKKYRKVERLRYILELANIPYSTRQNDTATAVGFTVFTFYAPLKVKEFDERFWGCRQEEIDIIYDEILYWDGSIAPETSGRYGRFTSTKKTTVDFVQAVFNSKGHIARITKDPRVSKYTGGECYEVVIRAIGKTNLLSYKSNNLAIKTVTPCMSTDGFKYCFTVPSTFLLFRRGGCVFASGNTGKTNSVIWAADYLMKLGAIKRVLVICPLSIMDAAWRRDLFRTVMHRSVEIAHGSREKRAAIIKGTAEIVIINYDGVEIVQKEIDAGGFDLVVVDEATHLKNVATKRWKVLNKLIKGDMWLWMLTGTPAAQSPVDAYGLAKIVNPKSVPKAFNAFRDLVQVRQSVFVFKNRPEAEAIVHSILQPAIRFTKEECLDLPELLYQTRDVPLSVQQDKYYKLLKKEMLMQAGGEEISAANAAVALNKLLQLSCLMYNTDVLTVRGWIPIQNVSPEDIVWDGEEWVSQEGAIYRGDKKVLLIDGVYMTEDHKVLTQSGWKPAGDIQHDKSSKGFTRASVRLPNGYSEGGDYNRNSRTVCNVAMSVPMWKPSSTEKSVLTGSTPNTPKKLWVSSRKRNTHYEQNPPVQQLPRHVKSVLQRAGQRLQKLWSSGDRGVYSLEGVLRSFLGRYGIIISEGAYSRENRQRQGVQRRELPLGDSRATTQQYSEKPVYRHPKREANCSPSSENFQYKTSNPVCQNKSLPLGYSQGTDTPSVVAVYDLLNCGPRNRFVVRGVNGELLIVHNCGCVYSDTGEVIEFDVKGRTSELLDIVDEASHKIIVFVMFRHTIELVQKALLAEGHTVDVIHGGVSVSKRAEIFNQFQISPDPRILVIQPQAAAHGVTLHAANTIVWWGITLSLETYMQANARIHRAGQINRCNVVHLIGSPVEKKVLSVLENKGASQTKLLDLFKEVVQ